MELSEAIRTGGPQMNPETLLMFSAAWEIQRRPKGQLLATQGRVILDEFILLNGQAISHITDQDGRQVCVGFHEGAGVITPHVARTHDNNSLVSIEITSEATFAHINTNRLTELMLAWPEIRAWGNDILHSELGRKSDREWCLAALNGRQRLAWFRDRFPNHEARFTHNAIASYLGVTPVTLSRLRNAD